MAVAAAAADAVVAAERKSMTLLNYFGSYSYVSDYSGQNNSVMLLLLTMLFYHGQSVIKIEEKKHVLDEKKHTPKTTNIELLRRIKNKTPNKDAPSFLKQFNFASKITQRVKVT